MSKKLSILTEQNDSKTYYSFAPNGVSFWKAKSIDNFGIIYSLESKQMLIIFPKSGLTPDAKGFLTPSFPDSIETNNNLAYLLRRHEIQTIMINYSIVSPEQLLETGILKYKEFSIINYALSISGINVNVEGNYSIGKNYLSAIKKSSEFQSMNWSNVAAWWTQLAINRSEYEGLVVLTWLFSLGFLTIDTFDQKVLSILSSRLQEANSTIKDFSFFNEKIVEVINGTSFL